MIFWGKRFLSAKTVREFAAGSEKWTLPPPPPPPSYGRSEEKEKEEEEEEEVPLPKVKMERDAISLPPSPEASEKWEEESFFLSFSFLYIQEEIMVPLLA